MQDGSTSCTLNVVDKLSLLIWCLVCDRTYVWMSTKYSAQPAGPPCSVWSVWARLVRSICCRQSRSSFLCAHRLLPSSSFLISEKSSENASFLDWILPATVSNISSNLTCMSERIFNIQLQRCLCLRPVAFLSGKYSVLSSKYRQKYRVGHLLADLGWVDLDFESSQAGEPLL